MEHALPRWRLGYRPGLDGLRGVAILLVVLTHANIPGFQGSGGVGVTAFFVLSGFLITALLLEERDREGRIGLRAFYRRRALRLLPALGVLLAVATVWYIATGRPGAVVLHVLPPAFYVANFARAAGDTLYHLGHTWSLAVEEQFYLVWPLLLIIVPRRWAAPLLVAAIIGSLAVKVSSDTGLAVYGPHAHAYALLAGGGVAFVARRDITWMPNLIWPGLVVLCVAFVPSELGLIPATLRWPIAALGALGIVASVAADRTSPVLTFRPLVALGTISYGLYLWHYFLISAGRYAGAPAVVMAFVSLPVAMASYAWIERPFLRLKSRRPSTSQKNETGVGPAVTNRLQLEVEQAESLTSISNR